MKLHWMNLMQIIIMIIALALQVAIGGLFGLIIAWIILILSLFMVISYNSYDIEDKLNALCEVKE